MTVGRLGCILLAAPLLFAAPIARAQTVTTGAIAGTVRDATGAVLPGVTVEAASPALIEKVRTAVSDDQGNYKIIDLRPGTYSVTFTLPGFGAYKRDGIELTTGFTASANAELKVGALAETVTVTGASPIVDVQNVRQQQVISREVLDSIPTAKGPQALYALTLGATGTGTDVGGTSATNAQAFSVHGSLQTDLKYQLDGMSYNTSHLGGGQAYYYNLNPVAAQEITIQTDGFNAETETGGAQVNTVPRDGGNRFSFFGSAQYADENMASDNVNAELSGRRIAQQGGTRKAYDYGIGVGGPIKRDRLWFYSSNRWNGSERYPVSSYSNASSNPLFYVVGKPTYSAQPIHDNGVRVTWKVSQRHKINASEAYQDQRFYNREIPDSAAPPAGIIAASTPTNENRWGPLHLAQVSWSHPRTNRLLLDAGISIGYFSRDTNPRAGITPTTISILEQTTGLRYGASGSNLTSTGGYGTHKTAHNVNQRASLSYVTGSHAFKTGVQFQQGIQDDPTSINESINYTFRNGSPIALTQFASPAILNSRSRSLGIYAQDQWSLSRLTLLFGLRFDRLNGYTLEQDVPASRFLPARHYDALHDVPNWTDLTPRLGAAFDLFGNGKTAVKASLGKYIAGTTGGNSIANSLHPANAIVNTANRTWTDGDLDFVPDCDFTNLGTTGECGPISDRAFGTARITTRYSDEYLSGFGARDHTWRWSAALQHELRPGLGLNSGYFGTAYGNMTVRENVAVTPQDFSPYCVTAPADPRLPSGGGFTRCGFWDIVPTRLGIVDTLVNPSSQYGDGLKQRFHAIDLALNARLPRRGFVAGGISTGVMKYDACFALDRPNVTVFAQNPSPPAGTGGGFGVSNHPDFCSGEQPWSNLTQVKVFASYPIAWGIEASANYQNLPGAVISATLNATSAQIAPSLGRNLAAGPTATVAIPLLKPFSMFEERMSQLDVRFTKVMRFGGTRVKGMLDIYNALNANTVLSVNSTYGAAWLRPSSILAPRLIKVGAELTF